MGSLCENSNVELARRKFVSITLNRKRTALAVAVERGKGRKQFCAFSARARFHTGWTQSRPISSCDFPALTARYWMVLIGAGSRGRASSWMDFDQTPA
jgi:hypothetical protein